MEKFSAKEVYEIITHIPKGKVVTLGETQLSAMMSGLART